MSRTEIADLEARLAAAMLIREGCPPLRVAQLTNTPVRFGRRLAREFGSGIKAPRSGDPYTPLWSSRPRVLQTSLFGMCLHRQRRARGAASNAAVIVEAYRMFRMLCQPTIGISEEAFTAHEAVLFVDAYAAGRLAGVTCERCRSEVWIPRTTQILRCPNCRASLRFASLV
jgi:hypothetical protein